MKTTANKVRFIFFIICLIGLLYSLSGCRSSKNYCSPRATNWNSGIIR